MRRSGTNAMASNVPLVIIIVLFIISCLSIPFQTMPNDLRGTVPSPGNTEPASTERVLVFKAGLPGPIGGIVKEVLEDYGDFVLVDATGSEVETLESMGVVVRPLTGRGTDAGAWAETGSATDSQVQVVTRFQVVQFIGPIKASWLDSVSEQGRIVKTLRGDRVVVKVMDRHSADLEQMTFIDSLSPYTPSDRIMSGFEGREGPLAANLIFFPGEESALATGLADIEARGGRVVSVFNDEWGPSAYVRVDASEIYHIATYEGLDVIEPLAIATPRLDQVRWVVQSGDPLTTATPIWAHNITGKGIIIGVADTGVDNSHRAFRDTENDTGVPGPSHRKIVSYNTSVDDWDDYTVHGTHTVGIISGDNIDHPGQPDTYDGIAYGSRVSFYDVVLQSNEYAVPPMTEVLEDAYSQGARSHSDSWGDDNNKYTTRAMRLDQFQWDHPDFLAFIAPGNNHYQVLEPATAKNIVSVGATENGNSNGLAWFSANGPTQEGLINPTIVVPGVGVLSPKGDLNRTNNNTEYTSFSGTSASTPVAAGMSALVEQYFRDGLYPSGKANAMDGFMPSGPLRKAMLVNAGRDIYGGANVRDHFPDNSQGWGKPVLDDVLYFEGDNRSLWIEDGYSNSTPGGHILGTGQSADYMFLVTGSEPLKIALVWNDYPGKGLLNDLDLTVTAPNGSVYHGNHYLGGESATGGEPDTLNPVETFFLKAPTAGHYSVRVTAVDVPHPWTGIGTPYSLVVTGKLDDNRKGSISLDKAIYPGNGTVVIDVRDADLMGTGKVTVTIASGTEPAGETVELSETDLKGVMRGIVQIRATGGPGTKGDGLLNVANEDTIIATYQDASPARTMTASALVDATSPVITGVKIYDKTNVSAIITWETNEPATSQVLYNTTRSVGEGIGKVANGSMGVVHHEVALLDLVPGTKYYFDVVSVDIVGNRALASNGGEHFNFTTGTYVLTPKVGDAGWINEGESTNHMDDEKVIVGRMDGKGCLGALLFRPEGLPNNSIITGATLRMLGIGWERAPTTPANVDWRVELLVPTASASFNNTITRPLYWEFADMQSAGRGTDRGGELLSAGQWTSIDLEEPILWAMNAGNRSEPLVFRISLDPDGPGDVAFAWDSGNTVWRNAPQIILSLQLGPIVDPKATKMVTFDEDTTGLVDLSTIFFDDSPMTFSILKVDPNITASIVGHQAMLQPLKDWNGEGPLTVQAMDADGITAIHNMTVRVMPVNDPVRVIAIGRYEAKEGLTIPVQEDVQFIANITVDDPDLKREGDLIEAKANETRVTVDENLTLDFIPNNADVGTFPVHLTVWDKASTTMFNFSFNVSNTNDAPTAKISDPVNGSGFNMTEAVVLDATGSWDDDLVHGDRLTYLWTSRIDGRLGETGNETVAVILSPGIHTITLRVTDTNGSWSEANITIEVFGDLDGDGLLDPYDDDIDGDGLPNWWEVAQGLDPRDPSDAGKDMDNDGASNLKEYVEGTDPKDPGSRPSKALDEGRQDILGAGWLGFMLTLGIAIGLTALMTKNMDVKRKEK